MPEHQPDNRHQNRRRGRWPAWLIGGLAVLAVTGVVVALAATSTGAKAGGHDVAASAPQNAGTIVGPVDGLNLAQDYQGKVLVVNYMASWCTACQVEIPGLVQTYDRFRGKGVQLVGISLQTSRTDTETMIRRLGIDYPVYLDATGAVAQSRFHLLGMPTTLVFENGRLLKRFDGEVSGSVLGSYLAGVTGQGNGG